MLCEEFEARLHYLLDRRQRPEQDNPLHLHASFCAECRELMEVQECLFDHLDGWETPLPASFGNVVVAQVVRQKDRRQSYTNWLAALAVAAALLLVLLPIGHVFRNSRIVKQPESQQQLAEVDPNFASTPERPRLTLRLLNNVRHRTREDVDDLVVIADEFRPIATSFTAAISAIRRTLPMGGKPAKPGRPAAGHGKSTRAGSPSIMAV